MHRQLPLKRALLWMLYSSLFTLIFGGGLIFLSRYVHKQRAQNEKYSINAILQTGPEKEALSTSYLAEALQLSHDQKTNLYAFNTEKAAKILMQSPLIKHAKIKKIFPDTLFVDYTVRTPIAILYDYTNTGIDKEGCIFPLSPFFTPKRLPEIYLGLLPFETEEDEFGRFGAKWNQPVESKEMTLALKIVENLSKSKYFDAFQLLRVDTSRAYFESCGQRQVVIVIEDIMRKQEDGREVTYLFPRILKINPTTYQKEIDCYLMLREKINDTPVTSVNRVKAKGAIIDLRMDQLAFVRNAT